MSTNKTCGHWTALPEKQKQQAISARAHRPTPPAWPIARRRLKMELKVNRILSLHSCLKKSRKASAFLRFYFQLPKYRPVGIQEPAYETAYLSLAATTLDRIPSICFRPFFLFFPFFFSPSISPRGWEADDMGERTFAAQIS